MTAQESEDYRSRPEREATQSRWPRRRRPFRARAARIRSQTTSQATTPPSLALRLTTGLVTVPLHRIRLPPSVGLASKSRICRKPSFQDRSGGSAHCKMAPRDPLAVPASGKSDTSSYRDLGRRRADLDQPGRPRSLPFRLRMIFRAFEQRADEIVIVRFGNAKPPNLSRLRFAALKIVDQGDAVDLRRLRRHPRLPQQIGFGRRPLHQYRNFRADHPAVLRARNSALQRHQAALPVLYRAAIHFAIERETGARVFIRIREDAKPVELRRLHELAKSVEIRIGLAGESDDEAGSDRHARNGAPDLFNQLQENIAIRAPLHSLQHRRARVLQRHID